MEKEKTISLNRKASHDYFLEDRYEAGLVLTGTEIKSIRQGKVQFKDAYISFINHEAYIKEMAKLIQRLSVDHLHILGDIFDRGAKSYLTMEHICNLPSVDITWGNHDIVYMGAAAGNKTCVASVIRACCKYNTLATLEDGYGIP